jgi:hypothetical protein
MMDGASALKEANDLLGTIDSPLNMEAYVEENLLYIAGVLGEIQTGVDIEAVHADIERANGEVDSGDFYEADNYLRARTYTKLKFVTSDGIREMVGQLQGLVASPQGRALSTRYKAI